MNLDLKFISQISAPSTVFQLNVDPHGRLWAAAPGGLFRVDYKNWEPVLGSFPLSQVLSVLSVGKIVWASGLSGGLVFSKDSGNSWQNCILEQVSSPVTCLCVSPCFDKDTTVLAGTAGDGILRSVDGGHVWQLANFGLRDFDIYTCVSSEWLHKETVYVGTSDGIYYSPNGGRAWRFSGLEGKSILSMALHPDFDSHPVILAGSDGEGLFRSLDGGKNWSHVDVSGETNLTVNTILFDGDLCLSGTSEAGILLSFDGGLSWKTTETQLPPVLCLARQADKIFASFYEAGIFSSEDGGRSWQQISEWVAHSFTSFAGINSAKRNSFLAGGLQSGLWKSDTIHSGWKEQLFQGSSMPVFALCSCSGKAYWGSEVGVFRFVDTEDRWEQCLSTPGAIISLACSASHLVAGSVDGQVWHSSDHGLSWNSLNMPVDGLPVVALNLRVQGENLEIFVALADQNRNMLRIWCTKSNLAARLPLHWDLWLSEHTTYGSVFFMDPRKENEYVAAIGNSILNFRDGQWQRFIPSGIPDPIRCLVYLPGSNLFLAAAGYSLFESQDLELWTPVNSGSSRKAFTGFIEASTLDGSSTIFGITTSGELFKINLTI